MTVGEDFLLLTTDPESGKCRLSRRVGDVVLGGAGLVDLMRADRIGFTGQSRKARVVLTDKTPLGDPVLDRAILKLQSSGPLKPRVAARRLGEGSMLPLYEALEARGEVQRREEKTHGLFAVTRWPAVDTVSRDNLVSLVQSSLMFGLDATERTGPLIGLLAESDELRLVVERPELRAAKARAAEITRSWPIFGPVPPRPTGTG